ncbi:NAD(P)H-binding protein [Actinomadura verrucosospora]|uniref:Nucleotide-diphosphate-sugar epimerase/NmrA family protein n=1 Tax=Actinomadura verrucosospora TaxID=46165 RepID=A0A7D3ZKL1_ACTVE|nr:NAD(P)H-binding protein [Actinomadura verrucosospora]QKG26417.1 nucleotide-diphosphate-sugar epimerase/NmrA family protein [Actinomadura verrucosospora]
MFLVTGGTGNVGREVAAALAGAGEPVRALTRGEAPADAPDGVEYVTGDLNKPETLTAALQGARGLFLLPGYAGMTELLAEAERAGVAHVVLLSGSSAESGDRTNAVSRYMIESEEAVRASGPAWTIVRPSGFMSNTFEWIPQLKAGDVVRAPFAGVPIAVIDPADIGAVVAAALLQDGHRGRVLRVTGPQTLLPADRLRILGGVLGRDLRLDAQPDDEARAEMLQRMPEPYVNAFFDFYVAGSLDESVVTTTVRDVTGRPPRTFEQWAAAHAASFA